MGAPGTARRRRPATGADASTIDAARRDDDGARSTRPVGARRAPTRSRRSRTTAGAATPSRGSLARDAEPDRRDRPAGPTAPTRRAVKLAVVVQRYGPAINGGAELHARYIAEHLARHAEVEVLTTCATDYVTWRNELAAGVEQVNGVTVRRFRVKHERDPQRVRPAVGARLRRSAIRSPTSSTGSTPKGRRARRSSTTSRSTRPTTTTASSSATATTTRITARAPPASRAILVPTAERDATIGLSIFQPLFRGVRALMYNSPEERAMIQAVSGNQDVPGVVVGIGSDVPQNPQPARFRQKYNIRGPFAVYVGRIDENKGCKELFEFFQGYAARSAGKLSLVLIGNSLLPIPEHPRIRHLGFLDDTDKFDAMAAADLLIMPSYFESLSMVALEAWALGRPVLANGKCDVLKGQCIRSNAGLYYETLRASSSRRCARSSRTAG